MARPLDKQQQKELTGFVNALYDAAGYKTTAKWAVDSDYPASNLSDLRNGKTGVDGYNLLRLIRSAAGPTAAANLQASQAGVAENVAKGYLVNHNLFPYQVVRFCGQASTGWSCPFTVDTQPVTVTVTLKAAKGGYVTTASSS